MAIRQYVGARYVPRFTGLYDVTQIYEALDVVDNGSGTSYIAKKTVPAGTPLTDTDFWFVYGSSSGAIISLQNRMVAAENNIIDLNNETAANDKKIASVRFKKYLIIGDSYERTVSFGSAVSVFLGHGATTFISTNVQKSADDYVYIASRGGSGFTNDGGGKSSGNGFLNMLTEAASNMSADVKKDIDCILIAGGVNDSFYNIGDPDIALLSTRMNDFNTFARANFPKAEVNLFFLGRVRQLDTHTGLNPKDVRYNIYRYIDLAGRKGWGYITNSEYVSYYRDAFIGSDDLHPTSAETNVIAKYIVEGLINGSVDVQWVDNIIYTASPVSGVSFIQPITIGCNVSNGFKTIHLPNQLGLGFNPSFSFAPGVPKKIATQDAIFLSSSVEFFIPCLAWSSDDNKFIMINTYLEFYGYDISIISRGAEGYGGSGVTIDSIQSSSDLRFMVDTLLT